MSRTRSKEYPWKTLGQYDQPDENGVGQLTFEHTSDTVSWEVRVAGGKTRWDTWSDQEFTALRDAIRELEPDPRIAEARALLSEIEWQGDEFGERCSSCGGRDLPNDEDSRTWAKTLQSRCGHAPDCRLAKFLEGK